MSTAIRQLCVLAAVGCVAQAANADGPGAWTGGCGEPNEPAECSGFGLTATCVCDSTGFHCGYAHNCCGQGWHGRHSAPVSHTSLPTPSPAIWSDPKPCAWRWKCRTSPQGADGESCITVPGCSFSGSVDTDKRFSYQMHPNLFIKGTCYDIWSGGGRVDTDAPRTLSGVIGAGHANGIGSQCSASRRTFDRHDRRRARKSDAAGSGNILDNARNSPAVVAALGPAANGRCLRL